MAFLGLGSFGTGFVTGFAESANKALQDDINRINNRVEKVADLRVKRAIDAQEERKKELKEIESALKEGAALFKGDPRAAEYAASLLEEQGSLSAYRSFVSELRSSQKTNPQDLTQFIKRADVDTKKLNGSYGITDYAKAWQGEPTTLPTQALPSGTSATAGSLVSKILGKDIDVEARTQKEVESQMKEIGLSTAPDKLIPMPTMSWDTESYMRSNMTAQERLDYSSQQLAKEEVINNEELRKQYEDMRSSDLQAVASGNNKKEQVSAWTMMLETTNDPEERKDLTDKIRKTNRQIVSDEFEATGNTAGQLGANLGYAQSDLQKLKSDPTATEEQINLAEKLVNQAELEVAEFSGNPEQVIQAKIIQAQRNNNYNLVAKLNRQLTEIKTGVKVSAKATYELDLVAHQNKMVEDPNYKSGNPTFDKEQERLATISRTLNAAPPGYEASLTDITSIVTNIKAITEELSSEIYTESGMTSQEVTQYQKIKMQTDNFTDEEKTTFLQNLEQPALDVYLKGENVEKETRKSIFIDRINSVGPRTEEGLNLLTAAANLGIDLGVGVDPDKATEEAKLAAQKKLADKEQLEQEQLKLNDFEKSLPRPLVDISLEAAYELHQKTPDTVESAEDIAYQYVSNNTDIDPLDIEAMYNSGYSDAYINAFKRIVDRELGDVAKVRNLLNPTELSGFSPSTAQKKVMDALGVDRDIAKNLITKAREKQEVIELKQTETKLTTQEMTYNELLEDGSEEAQAEIERRTTLAKLASPQFIEKRIKEGYLPESMRIQEKNRGGLMGKSS